MTPYSFAEHKTNAGASDRLWHSIGFPLRAVTVAGCACLLLGAKMPTPDASTRHFRIRPPISAAAGAALDFRAIAHSYGWPLRPFGRQHAIRGGFGDPRFGARQHNFHFGIDIPAPGGTPVFAVAAGTVFLAPDRVTVLRGSAVGERSGFAYWHVLPAVVEHRLVRAGQLVGWVNPAWGHLHFAEMENGRWVNPLRPGALEPYRSDAVPRIVRIGALERATRSGERLTLTVDAFVPPPLPLIGLWRGARLAPTWVRWRLLEGTHAETAWTTSLDFRISLPPNALFASVYAPGTLPNLPGRPGRYVVYLARNWRVPSLDVGVYRLEVQVRATGGAGRAVTSTISLPRPGSLAKRVASRRVPVRSRARRSDG